MKRISFFIILLIPLFASAQTNLVSNGDFEIYSSMPTDYCQTNLAIGWNNVNFDYSCIKASPDYYNVFSFSGLGSIIPYSGNSQMGFVAYQDFGFFREYISSLFTTSMSLGRQYTISFYLTNGIDTLYTKRCNNIGIHFSINPLNQAMFESIPVMPQIEIDTVIYFWNYWQHFSFNYIADSSYNYITIGNFRDDAHTSVSSFGSNGAYYFIDKIEIIPILIIIGDTVLCKGDSATLFATADSTVQWVTALKPDSIFSTNTTIKVKPVITTIYLAYGTTDTASFTVNVVEKPIINLGPDTTMCNGYSINLDATQNNATYLWQDHSINSAYTVTQQGMYWVTVETYKNCSASDTVIISYTNCETPEIFIPNSFTPNGDGLNDVFYIKTIAQFSKFNLFIYNRWGQLIFETDDAVKGWDGTFKGKMLSLGVYIFFVEATIRTNNETVKYRGKVTLLN